MYIIKLIKLFLKEIMKEKKIIFLKSLVNKNSSIFSLLILFIISFVIFSLGRIISNWIIIKNYFNPIDLSKQWWYQLFYIYIDKKIKFISWMSIFYSWAYFFHYWMLIVVILFILKKQKQEFYQKLNVFLFWLFFFPLVSYLIHIFFPIYYYDFKEEYNNSLIFKFFNYFISSFFDFHKGNSLPSLHFMFPLGFSIFLSYVYKFVVHAFFSLKIIFYFSWISTILIYFSTFLCKRHYVIDGFITFLLGSLIYWLINKYLYFNLKQTIFNKTNS